MYGGILLFHIGFLDVEGRLECMVGRGVLLNVEIREDGKLTFTSKTLTHRYNFDDEEDIIAMLRHPGDSLTHTSALPTLGNKEGNCTISGRETPPIEG